MSGTPAPADLDPLADMLERGDPDRFRALLAAPLTARATLLPIYAFNLEVARAPYASEEPMICEMRLQFWRDVLEEIAAGGPVRRHEVATPLAAVLAPETAATLDACVAARRWDCYRAPFEDAAHFDAYVAETYGGPLWAAAHALGATDRAPVAAFAAAAGRAAFLLAVPELIARGRRPLAHGTSETDLAGQIARDGLAAMSEARSARRRLPPAALPALLPGWRAPAILKRAARDPARVLTGGLPEAEARKRIALARAALFGAL